MFPVPFLLTPPAGPPVAVYDSAGAGPALLLLHGNSLDTASTYGALWNEPALAHYRRVAFDWPGCGASPMVTDGGRLPALVGTLVATVGALKLTDYLIIAHSLGGHIALEALAQLPVAPRGLLLVGTPPVGSAADVAAAFQPDPRLGLLYAGAFTDEQRATLTAALLLPTAPVALHAVLADALRRSDPTFRLNLGASIGAGELSDEKAVVQTTAVPLAFAQGVGESLINGAYVRTLVAPTRWGEPLHEVAGAGHLPMLENPAATAALVAALARGVGLTY